MNRTFGMKSLGLLVSLPAILLGCTPESEEPGYERLVNGITMSDSDGNYCRYSIEYEGDRPVYMSLGFSEGEVSSSGIKLEWGTDALTMTPEESGETGPSYVCRLEDGRVTSTEVSEGDETFSLQCRYDSEGRLSAIADGESAVGIEWENGNMKKLQEEESLEYSYSEFYNASNLDLNWIFAYVSDFDIIAFPGLLGLNGVRSRNVVAPVSADLVHYFPPDIVEPSEPISEDCDYTYSRTFKITAFDELATDYGFDGGLIVSAKSCVPEYNVTEEVTVRMTITDYSKYVEDGNGVKWYSEYEVTEVSRKEISREMTDEKTVSFEISYLEN